VRSLFARLLGAVIEVDRYGFPGGEALIREMYKQGILESMKRGIFHI